MTYSFLISSLLIISTLTSLATEGIKKILEEYGKTYHSNILVGIVAVIISIAYAIAYIAISGTSLTTTLIIYFICLIFFSWLCAMLGYDKVIQTITQLKED